MHREAKHRLFINTKCFAFQANSQALVSSVNVSRSFIGSLISTIVLLFVGPWSDCSGRRKPLLILPLVGMCVMTTGVLLMLTFPGASTAQVLYVVQIPISMGGNFGLLLAASFSYIGDVSSPIHSRKYIFFNIQVLLDKTEIKPVKHFQRFEREFHT